MKMKIALFGANSMFLATYRDTYIVIFLFLQILEGAYHGSAPAWIRPWVFRAKNQVLSTKLSHW